MNTRQNPVPHNIRSASYFTVIMTKPESVLKSLMALKAVLRTLYTPIPTISDYTVPTQGQGKPHVNTYKTLPASENTTVDRYKYR